MPPSSGLTTSTVRPVSGTSVRPSRALADVARKPLATRKPPRSNPAATRPDTSQDVCDEPLADGATSHLVVVKEPADAGSQGEDGLWGFPARGRSTSCGAVDRWVNPKGRWAASASIKHEEEFMHAACRCGALR